MSFPKASIIIPCYNQGKYLRETVESALSQTLQDLEVVIVDDGSTDKATKKILREFQDPRIKVITIENSGVSTARNIGFSNSSGEYVLFLDGDDKISKDYLEKACLILKNNKNIKVVSCEVDLFGVKSGRYKLPEFSLAKLLGRNILVISCVIRSEDFRRTDGFNVNMNAGFEDWDFWLTLLEDGGEVYKIDEVCFFYRISRRSRNHTIKHDKFQLLREQIFINHQSVYRSNFFDPVESFEYQNLRNSREYLLGQFLLTPIRGLYSYIKKF